MTPPYSLIEEVLHPDVSYEAPRGVPAFPPDPQKHISKHLVLSIPPARPGEIALDFGCGQKRNKPLLEQFGYRYVGFDARPDADVVGDGHHLPFQTGSFDLIVSIAVLEHLHDPWQACRELHRVLKPGGLFVGSTAFLEPFHANSYFHMSHLGLQRVLRGAGFTVEKVWAGSNVVEAQLRSLFPAPRPAARALAFAGDSIWGLSQCYFHVQQSLRMLVKRLAPRRLVEHQLTFASGLFFVARAAKVPA